MKIRTQVKAGGRTWNHNEIMQVRTGLQGGKKRALMVRAGLRGGQKVR